MERTWSVMVWSVIFSYLKLSAATDDPYRRNEKALSYFSLSESNASYVTGLQEGTKEYMRILHVKPDYILVGAKNVLYKVNTITMEVEAVYSWSATAAHQSTCEGDREFYRRDCDSYIRSIHTGREDGKYVVCASSAKTPACRQLSVTDEGFGDWTYTDNSIAYAPVFPWEDLVVYKTAEQTVYAATHYYLGVQAYHILFRDGFISENAMTVPSMGSMPIDDVINSDVSVGMVPRFVKIFETADHVYLLFTEPARETYSTQKMVYSRVARVCKSDRGNPYVGNNYELMTFFKARLLCGIPERHVSTVQETDTEEETLATAAGGYYSYYFNELVSATSLHTDSVSGEKLLIAAFNNPRNSLGGSAICMYKVSDIEKVFEQSPLAHQTGSNQDSSKRPAKCPESTLNLTAEQREDSKKPLLSKPVTAVDNDTLFIQARADYKVTQMVVDWQVQGPDRVNRSVIFISTDNGSLLKLVKYKKPGNKEASFHLVEEREIFSGKPIQEMKLITDSNKKKHILLNTYNDIKRVAVEKCHKYTDCYDCIAIRDPYCSWSRSQGVCVSTSHSAKDRFQNVDTGRHEVCGTYELTTAVDSAVVTESDLKDGDDGVRTGDDKGIISKPPGSSKQQTSPQDNLQQVLIALIVVCSIVCFFGGCLAAYVYLRWRYRSPTSHLESELTRGTRRKILDRCDSDAYQSMPGVTPHKLDYKNNLALEKVNTSTSAPPDTTAVGESTLSRAKKIYV